MSRYSRLSLYDMSDPRDRETIRDDYRRSNYRSYDDDWEPLEEDPDDTDLFKPTQLTSAVPEQSALVLSSPDRTGDIHGSPAQLSQ